MGAGVIYRAVTLQQAGRRRRREAGDSGLALTSRLQDIIMLGQSCSASVTTMLLIISFIKDWKMLRSTSIRDNQKTIVLISTNTLII